MSHNNMTSTDGDKWEYPLVSFEIILIVAIATVMVYKHSHTYKETVARIHNDRIWQSSGVISATKLAMFRLIVLLYFIVIQIHQLYMHGIHCLAFYTTWNFLLQIMFFAIVSYVSFQIQREREPSARLVHAAFILFDVCFTCCFLVATVVWLILYPMAKKSGTESHFLTLTSYTQHGLNVLLFAIEFLTNQFYAEPFHAAFIVYWPTLYTLFTWVVHGSTSRGFWPYPFMKVREPYSPIWYFGLLLAHLSYFLLVLGLSRLKRRWQSTPRALDRKQYQNIAHYSEI